MSIAIACPSCSKRFNVPDSAAGKTGRCKTCGQTFKIPGAPAAPAPAAVRPTSVKAAKPSDPHLDRLRNAPIPGLDDDEVLEPRPVRPAKDSLDHLRYQALDEDEEEAIVLELDDSPSSAPLPPAKPPKAVQAWPSAPASPVPVKKRKSRASAGLGEHAVPAAVFVGGSAILWIFLLVVVQPSMQGRAQGGNPGPGIQLPPEVMQHLPGLPPEMREAMARARPGDNGYPQLPPPDPHEFPAGTNPADRAAGNIRADVAAAQERSMNELIGFFNQFSDAFDSVQNAETARAAGPRIQQIAQDAQAASTRARNLQPPNADEARELVKRIKPRADAAIKRLRESTQRLTSLPGVGASALQLTHGVSLMTSGLEQALNIGGPAGGPRPYVELFVEGIPDSDVHQVVYEKLGPLTDDPGAPAIAAIYLGGGDKSSYRVCPVADPRAFAQKISFGKASVKGHTITLTGLKIDPDEVAAYRKKIEAERTVAAASTTGTPPAQEDPQPPPDADAITKSLFKLKSSNGFRQREGLKELSLVIPDDARREEVVQAIIPLATGTDHFNATEAVRTLANWPNDQAIDALIHVVQRSDDHFVRVEAMNSLAKLKSEKAVPAIAARLSEDWVDAPKALRAIGPAAEPELIKLLADTRADQRKAACELLKDLGGVATFEAMAKLPADQDPFVQGAARDAMEAIGNRIGPDEVKRIQGALRKKR